MKKLVLVINGVDAVIFNEVPNVKLAVEDGEFISVRDYMVSVLKSNMDYDAIYEYCDFDFVEKEIDEDVKIIWGRK